MNTLRLKCFPLSIYHFIFSLANEPHAIFLMPDCYRDS